MLEETLPHKERQEVVAHEDVVLRVHVQIAECKDQLMNRIAGLDSQELALDGSICLLDHPELLLVRILDDAIRDR